MENEMEDKTTFLSEVYDFFLSSITDYTLLKDDPKIIEDDLFTYFRKARAKFHKCKQKLSVTKYENEKCFGYKESEDMVYVKLTDYEISILAHLMLSEYLKTIVMSTEVLKQSLSDKDFRIYSQANQLRELNLLYRLVQKECSKMITEYSYMGMTDNDK